jgi:CRISPR-associated protein Cas2
MTVFLIGYDIRDPRRLQRVHRAMLRHAMAIEYSIFLLHGNVRAVRECLDEILPLIAPRDDVRCYCLPTRGWQERLGRPVLPPGIFWTGLPTTI